MASRDEAETTVDGGGDEAVVVPLRNAWLSLSRRGRIWGGGGLAGGLAAGPMVGPGTAARSVTCWLRLFERVMDTETSSTDEESRGIESSRNHERAGLDAPSEDPLQGLGAGGSECVRLLSERPWGRLPPLSRPIHRMASSARPAASPVYRQLLAPNSAAATSEEME